MPPTCPRRPCPPCTHSLKLIDTDSLRTEALRRLKGEAEGEGQRRKVVVSPCAACLAQAGGQGQGGTHPAPGAPLTTRHLPRPQAASERKKEGASALDEFCRDLCQQAASQSTDPVRVWRGGDAAAPAQRHPCPRSPPCAGTAASLPSLATPP